MIRLKLKFMWSDRHGETEEQFITRGRREIEDTVAQWVGYQEHELELDQNSENFWLVLKPQADYEMDEGL